MFNFILEILTIYLCGIANNKCNFASARSTIGLRERLQRNPKMPPSLNGQPLQVLAGIYIESLGNFRAADMSFDVDLYLYLSWKDNSLNHSSNEYVLLNDPNVRRYIWLPDLYFANARISRFHDVIAPNFNLFIDQNGEIAYSTRITLGVACNLDLSLYPMDSQRCAIQFLSYAYIEKQIKVLWFNGNATRYNPEIQLPEFRISNISSEYCNGIYNYAIMEYSHKRDKFSCLEAIIHLNRQIGYHVVQSYIPTGLIVIISWGNGLRFGLPQVAYAKAIDFWFGACLFFVFLSLLEFAAVNSYMRHAEKFERYATYYAKKNSSLNAQTAALLSRNEAFGERNEKEESLKSRADTLSLLPSIDATPSDIDESFEEVKWSSAATIGEINPNVWLSSISSPAIYQKEEENNCKNERKIKKKSEKEKQKINNNKMLIKRTTHFKPFYQTSSFDKLQNENKHRSKNFGKIETNPLITNHVLRQGFLYSRKGLAIDRLSRWLFPLAFTIWNAFYWLYYLYYVQIKQK
uniref:Neur_chan_LBD domain-containing protein n=1 Tax=Meloidogyne hapla TaxID=6305 RepID=A0A1I8C371_MELHA